jgi:hypothetical protein
MLPIGVDFGYLILFRRRGVLSLGQAIYLVIENKQVDIKVPTEQMDSVIAAYTKAVTVATYNPNA